MRICPKCFGLYAPDQTTCPKDGAATESHTDILIGQQLGPYVARTVIGEGGMGVVYAGEHPALGKRVALKVLRPELSLREDIVERFVQEARAVNTIGHANIVKIYDFGRTPFGSFYFVMEYLDGQTLRSIVEKVGAQPLERVKMVVLGVGAALAAAHAKGFIHRDVKPENVILVSRAGQESIKLLDFGIVKLLTADARQATQTGAAMGTPQYMCPEQLEDAPVDYRADIYALGVLAYELLTGSVPYPGKSQGEVRQLQLTRMPPPPSVSRAESRLSRALDAAVLWAISLDPAQRPRRMEDFLSAFQTGYDRTLVEQSHGSGRPAGGLRRRAGLGVGLILAAVLFGGGVTLIMKKVQRRSDGAGSGTVAVQPRPDAGRLVSAPHLEARRLLVEGLAAEDAELRREAVKKIGESGRPLLLDQIRALIDDLETAREAAEALAALGDQASAPILRKALVSATGIKKLHLARALALLGEEPGRKTLQEEIKNPNRQLSNLALDYLGQLCDPAARLSERLKNAEENKFETEIRKLLGHLTRCGDRQARQRLLAELRHKDWQVVLATARALGSSDEVKERLTQLRQDQEAKLGATMALADFGDDSAGQVLVESLGQGSIDPSAREQAILLLGRLHATPEREKVLRAFLEDVSPGVRLAAASVLAKP